MESTQFFTNISLLGHAYYRFSSASKMYTRINWTLILKIKAQAQVESLAHCRANFRSCTCKIVDTNLGIFSIPSLSVYRGVITRTTITLLLFTRKCCPTLCVQKYTVAMVQFCQYLQKKRVTDYFLRLAPELLFFLKNRNNKFNEKKKSNRKKKYFKKNSKFKIIFSTSTYFSYSNESGIAKWKTERGRKEWRRLFIIDTS